MTEILSIDLIDAISPKDSERTHTDKLRMLQCRPTTRQWIWREKWRPMHCEPQQCFVDSSWLHEIVCVGFSWFCSVLVWFWFSFGWPLCRSARGLVCHVARRCCSRRNYGQHRRSSGRLRRSCRTIGPATRSVETGEFPLKPLNLKHWPLTSWINLCQMLPTQLLDVQFFFPVRCQKIADWHCRRWKKSSPAWLGRKCLEFDFGVENGCALLKFLLQGHSKSMDLRGDNARLWGKTFVEIWWKLSQIE